MNLFAGELEADALVTDRYLESILAAHERGADDAPADPAVDPRVRLAVRRLSADLVRVHPSFRFEERLAARLAETAARMRLQAAGGENVVVPVPFGSIRPAAIPDATLGSREAGHPGNVVPRPVLIGVTSAAISLAGAAYVAWRRGRVPLSPMARAVRAVGGARLAGSRGRPG